MRKLFLLLLSIVVCFFLSSCRNVIVSDLPAIDKPVVPEKPSVSVWDGSLADTEELVAKIQNSDTISINSAAELAALADIVNGTAQNLPEGFSTKLTGKTIILETDIDLAELPWTTIGRNTKSMMGQKNGNPFEGVFDGNHHTIKGLNVTAEKHAGLFGYVHNASFRNITVEGTSTGTSSTANGLLIGTAYYDMVAGEYAIENIMVNGKVSGEAAGGAIGLLYVNPPNSGAITVNISEITIDGEISSPIRAGGLVERIDINKESGTVNISDIESNATITVTGGSYGNTVSAGGIICRINSSGTINIGNDSENGTANIVNGGDVSITSTDKEAFVGGIIGDIQTEKNTIITNVENNGVISSSCQAIAGGIVGRVAEGILVISKAINAGAVTALDNYIGGIAGGAFDINLTISDSENNAAIKGILSADASRSMYVGGILGFGFEVNSETILTMADVVNTGKISSDNQSDTQDAYVGGIAGGILNVSGSLSDWESINAEKPIGSNSNSEDFTISPIP